MLDSPVTALSDGALQGGASIERTEFRGAVAMTDVLIVAALPEELIALREVSEGARGDWVEDKVVDTPYLRRTFETSGSPLEVAAVRPTRMAGVATAGLASSLVVALRPRWLAMCGVCAGHPDDTELGDVVLADRVYQYDEGKRKEGGVVEGDTRTHPLCDDWHRAAQEWPSLVTGIHGYAVPDDEARKWWFLGCLLDGRDPLAAAGRSRYFPDSIKSVSLRRLKQEGLVGLSAGAFELTEDGRAAVAAHRAYDAVDPVMLPFAIHVGPIGSGNEVVTDPEVWSRLKKGGMRKVLGLDMEAAAVGAVAHDKRLDFVVAKGVMDHAGSGKGERFKAFAARASAEVLLGFLRERRGAEPQTERTRPARASAPPVAVAYTSAPSSPVDTGPPRGEANIHHGPDPSRILPRTVVVAGRVNDASVVMGSGTVVAQGRVLTALSVVCRDGTPVAGLCVRGAAAAFDDARVLWLGSGGVDVALLGVPDTLGDGSGPLDVIEARTVACGDAVGVDGYLGARWESPRDALRRVDAKVRGDGRDEAGLALLLEGELPDAWAGMSGAGVVLDGRLVGVVEHVVENEERTIGWTPVGRFAGDRGFEEALVTDEVRRQLKSEIKAVSREIVTLLRDHETLCLALAKRMKVEPATPARIADVMLYHCKAKALARDLGYVWRRDDLAEHRERVRELLELVLRYATDVRHQLAGARAAMNGGLVRIDLHCFNATMAEAIMAGIDGRSMALRWEGDELFGVAMVKRPARTHVPGWDKTGEGDASAVEEVVRDVLGEVEKALPGGRSSTSGLARRYGAADAWLEEERDGPPGSVSSYYLLWEEADDERWRVVTTAIHERLPSLVTVRLMGTESEAGRDDTAKAVFHRMYTQKKEGS